MNKKDLEIQIQNSWEDSYSKADIPNLPWEAFKPPSRLVRLADSGKIKIGKAIDLGCGLGTNAVYLAQKGFEVTALDASKTALLYASEKAKKAGVKINFIQGFAHKLDFPEKIFSLVFDRGCFHHIPPELRQDYLEGIYRVLADKASYYLECFSSSCAFDYGYKFSIEDIEKIFGRKFEIIEFEEIKNKDREDGEIALNSVFMLKK